MTQIRIIFLLAGCLVSAGTMADATVVTARVVGEDGPIFDGLEIRLDGQQLSASDTGQFEFSINLSSAAPFRVEISADGYYSALQTLHRSDFVGGGTSALPTIELVRKKSGRRLLMFAGDSMLSRRYFEPRANEPVLVRRTHLAEDSRALLQHVKRYIELADYASANLETQLSAATLSDHLPKSVTFYSPPELAETLQWAGFDYVALGNNHMFDFQDEALRSTLATLDRIGLDHSGGGVDDTRARLPAVVEIGDSTHAFLSYVGWPGTFSPSQVADSSKGGAALGDSIVIAEDLGRTPFESTAVLQLHAGLEYSARPALSEQTTLRQAVRDGADLVLGHHAHVLQGFEVVDNKLIAYSLGNFLFDQYHYTTQMGMLLFVWMDRDSLHRAEAVPLHINGYVPTPATGEYRYAVLNRLASLSDSKSVCMRPNGFHATLQSCGGDSSSESQRLEVGQRKNSIFPVALRALGASPLAPVQITAKGSAYRLGVDIWRRGDFESAGLFGTHDRSWIESDQARLVGGDNPHLRIDIGVGDSAVRTGLKVFERVYATSNPTTVSGRVRGYGNVRLRALLQSRGMTETLEGALADGRLTEVGAITLASDGWNEFAFDYDQPREEVRSIRLLFEVESISSDGAWLELDDLAWVEWRTPWVQAHDKASPEYATHLQFQR